MSLTVIVLIAIGGAFAVEGAVWAIFPAQMRRMYHQAMSAGDRMLHLSGLFSVALGVVLIMLGVGLVGM